MFFAGMFFFFQAKEQIGRMPLMITWFMTISLFTYITDIICTIPNIPDICNELPKTHSQSAAQLAPFEKEKFTNKQIFINRMKNEEKPTPRNLQAEVYSKIVSHMTFVAKQLNATTCREKSMPQFFKITLKNSWKSLLNSLKQFRQIQIDNGIYQSFRPIVCAHGWKTELNTSSN